jgi:hypothetical protein
MADACHFPTAFVQNACLIFFFSRSLPLLKGALLVAAESLSLHRIHSNATLAGVGPNQVEGFRLRSDSKGKSSIAQSASTSTESRVAPFKCSRNTHANRLDRVLRSPRGGCLVFAIHMPPRNQIIDLQTHPSLDHTMMTGYSWAYADIARQHPCFYTHNCRHHSPHPSTSSDTYCTITGGEPRKASSHVTGE